MALHHDTPKASAFFTLLQEAGKPASLHITKYDLPENYGIISSDFRTKQMSHSRYRLASASRGSKRKGLPIDTTTPIAMNSSNVSFAKSPEESDPLPSAPKQEAEQKGSFSFFTNEPFFAEATTVPNDELADPVDDLSLGPLTVVEKCPEAEVFDAPGKPSRRLVVAPLTQVNVALYRSEPKDPVTGVSMMEAVQQALVAQWQSSQQSYATPAVCEEESTDRDENYSPHRTNKSVTHHQTPSRRARDEAHSPSGSIKGLSPIVKKTPQRGTKPEDDQRGNSPVGSPSIALSPLDGDAVQVERIAAQGDASLKLSPVCPLSGLSSLDPMHAVLQSLHFSSASYPKKSWLRLSEPIAGDELSEASCKAVAAGVLKESAYDASMLQQRMMSTALYPAEVEVLKGVLLMSKQGLITAMQTTAPVGGMDQSVMRPHITNVSSELGESFSVMTPTNQQGTAGSPARSFAGLAKVVKSSVGDDDGLFGRSFSGLVKKTVGAAQREARDDVRSVMLKLGGSPQFLLKFSAPDTVRSLPLGAVTLPQTPASGDSSPLKRLAAKKIGESQAHSEVFPLPSWATLLIPDGKQGTKWNFVLQHLLDQLYSSTSALRSVQLHKQLSQLHRMFVEYCASFVEKQLLSVLLSELQLCVDSILFTVVTVNETPQLSGELQQTDTAVMDAGDEGSLCVDGGASDDEGGEEGDAQHSKKEKHVDIPDIEAHRKISSAQLRSLTAFSKYWFKVGLHPSQESPFANEDTIPLAAPLHDAEGRMRSNAQSATGDGPRDTVFPLSCSVSYLGFVIHCTARMPTDAEQDCTPVSKSHISTPLMMTVGHELGVAPYVETVINSNASGVFSPTERNRPGYDGVCPGGVLSRVDTSRHVLYGFSQAEKRRYLFSAPTIMPALTPTMKYSRWLRLRSEFTQYLTEPLPSDVFSSSATLATFPLKPTAQANAVKCARKLLHKTVTDIVRCWEEASEQIRGDDLCEAMHRRGINMTILGYIGDLLHSKIRSLTNIAAAATTARPSGSSSSGQRGDNAPQNVIGKKIDALTKALSVVKEEMAVRAFRVYWNQLIREKCTVSQDMRLSVLRQATTQAVKTLLGTESDPVTSTFWSNTIMPHIRSRFCFRAPMGRKDLSVRTTLHRLESLCGIVLTPGTAADALNASMLTKHQDLLSLDLRNTRAIAIGSVIELRPYVKAPPVPYLPPLWRLSDVDNKNATEVFEYLRKEGERAEREEGPLSHYCQHLQVRRAEVLFAYGENMFEPCEHLLLGSIVRLQTQMVPLYREGVEQCLRLSRLLFASHRNIDSARCADDAISVALVLPQSLFQPSNGLLFASLHAAAKESGNRELTIHVAERAIAASVKRMEHLIVDPYGIHRTWDLGKDIALRSNTLCPLKRQLQFERTLFSRSVDALVEAYKTMSYHTMDHPLPFHETTVSPFFLQFLYEIGDKCCKHGEITEAKAIFARALHLSEILLYRSGEQEKGSQVVDRCRANVAMLRDM